MQRWPYILTISLSFLAFPPAHPAPAKVIYVAQDAIGNGSGSNWDNACTTITAGIEASDSGDEIWVKSAMYPEAVVLNQQVSILGGFLGSETIRDERDWTANEAVIDASGLGDSAVRLTATRAILDGFTITGGVAESGGGIYSKYSRQTVTNCTIKGNIAGKGGGVYCGADYLTITNCTIVDNTATSGGGGVYCYDSSPTISDCTIEGNYGRGVYAYNYSKPDVVRCIIRNNHSGGLFSKDHSRLELISCQVIGNVASWGGGIYCCDHSSVVLTSCIVSNNKAASSGGGVVCEYSSLTMKNCILANNSAAIEGGGIYCAQDARASLENCTIVGNRAEQGSTIYTYEPPPTLVNCILWNYGCEISSLFEYQPSVSYCCVQGGWPGEGNIDGTPRVVDLEGGDYHLRNGSSCIGRGSIEAAPSEDLEGRPRPGSDGKVDIGAYESPDEYEAGPAADNGEVFYVCQDVSGQGDGSSWESAFTSLNAALSASSVSDEIWVASGTYGESILMEPGVALYGGFLGGETSRDQRDWAANRTIINATGLNTQCVVGAESALLDGFTITGGKAEYGGGLFFRRSSPTIVNSMITDNRATRGGGMYCIYSSPTLLNCTITDNSACEHGGVLYCLGSSPKMVNCTIAHNTAASGSCGAYGYRSFPVLINCIMWNCGDEFRLMSSFGIPSLPQLTYCCIHGGWPGEGNISLTPMFVSVGDSDYHLQNGSPCIDRGLVAEAPSIDLEGWPRPGGDGKVDIGAYESPDEYEPGPPPPPPVLYVAKDASGNGDGSSWQEAYTTIAAARAFSASGDEIWVKSARYNESIQLKQGVTVLGGFLGWETSHEQRDWTLNETIIDATGLWTHVITGVDEAVLDGFTITGGGRGVYCFRSSPTLLNCTIRDNTASREGGGVYCWESSPTLTNCIITKNGALEYGGGLCCNATSSPRLVNCTIVDNRAMVGGGVFSRESSPTLINCILRNRGDEIAGDSIDSVTVTHSCVDGGWPGEGNIDGDPLFVDRQGGDFHLQDGSSCIGRGLPDGAPTEDIEKTPRPGTDGKVDIGAYECPGECQPGPAFNIPRVIFARSDAAPGGDGSSWESAYSSITAAIEVAGTSDEVWVASGTYGESVHLEPRVAVYGGFLGTETSRGQRDPFVNRTIVDATGLNTHAVVGADLATLDGFTLTGGQAEYGGGLFCSYSSPTLAQCVVTGNTSRWGAGAYFGVDSSGMLTECTIMDNAASQTGGGVFCSDASPTLSNCVIMGNNARSGAGVCCERSFSTLAGCSITNNAASEVGGGMYCYESSPSLANCTIVGNAAARDGGAFYCNQGASPTLTNCKIVANTAKGNGGALNCSTKASPALINCTIVGNRAAEHGAGIYCHDATPTLVNSILWNPGFEVSGEASDSVRATYCCVQGGWPGQGNIDGKPLFVDSRGGDFHLRNGSSCIGSASADAAPAEDLDGRPRPGGDGRVDIGAYESPDGYQPGPSMNVPEVLYVRAEAPSGGDGSSWESAYSSISAALEVASTSDEIWVGAGVYPEPVQLEPRVSVYGGFGGWEEAREARIDGNSRSIIDATGLNTHAVVGVDLAVLEGFTITGGHVERGGGLYCNSTSPTLIRCMITKNSADEGGGVYCLSASPTLTQCRISGNSAADGGGLYCSVDSSPTLANCMVTKNRATDHGRAIYCSHSCPTLTNCTIADNSGNAGISAIYTLLYSRDPRPVLLNCIVWNPGDQIQSWYIERFPQLSHCCVHGGWPGEGNISDLPMFVSAVENDYRLQNGSPCIDRGLVAEAPSSDLEGRSRPGGDGMVDMGAYESPDEYEPAPPAHVPVVYVAWDATGRRDGTCWQDAFTTIAAGLATSASGDEVWVKGGTYAEAIALRKGVALFGGFSGLETIHDPRNWAAYPTVINATGLDKCAVIGANNSILDGFTITGGSARYGGGISASGITQTVRNCTIRGNLGEWGGGGVYFSRVRLTMARCIIANNFGGFRGGGLYCEITSGSIVNCTISANRSGIYGGGLYISGDAYSQCDASDGEIPADCTRSCPTFTNCLITGNQAPDRGGGVYCSGVTPMFKNCTIAGNAGSGVYSHLQFFFEDWVGSDYSDDFLECGCEGVPSLVNCIIWNVNPLRVEWGYWDCYGDVEVTDPGQKGADIIYSCVQGGWYGQALDIDPQFVDPAAGDYRLQPGSPCIDTGTNDPVLDINVDIDGNARIWNGQVDMGAYEFDSEVPPPTPTATATPTATVTPTATPTGKATPPPRQLWLLDGFGHVYVLPSPTPTAEPGSELVVDLPGGVTMEMVLIPAGSFMMGRYPGEQDSYYYEDPQHMVTLSQDFYLGKYEVTQAQWQAVLGTPPWSAHRYVLDDPNSPAIYVSWNDISGTGGFIEKMNALGQGTFRLPSEAEWEYACRAQTAKRFYWGDDPSYSMIGDYAWYYNNAYAIGESYAHFVGQKLPNDWGLHDMSGNVSEWCQDYWHDSYDTNGGGVADAPTDGSAWELPTSSYRVVRGGYWGSHAQGCRSAYRGWGNPDYRFIEVGVRVARTR